MSALEDDLDKLRVFVAVAEKRKINAASLVLHLTQPSVSRAIQKLERSFGAELFFRSRDGVKLTKAGQLLYGRAVRLMRELEDIQVQAKHIDEDLKGHLTAGTYESLAEYLWPDFLLRLQKNHPHLQLSIKTSLHRDPQEDLASGRMDLLVDAEPVIRRDVTSWPLYQDKFGFFISTETDDMSYEAISYVQTAVDRDRLTIADHIEKAGHKFARKHCFDSFSTVKQIALKGMGIAVLPQRLARNDVQKKLIRPLALKNINPDGFGTHRICATASSENVNDSRLRKIVSLLRDVFR